MKNDASFLYNGFFSRIIKNRPYITLKIGCSLDGKIALKNNKSKWITNELSRAYSHLIRSQNDAILTTSSTIIEDNPEMNCRLDGLEHRSPDKVILDRFLKVKSNHKILNSSLDKNIFIYSLCNMDNYIKKNKNVIKIKIKKNLNNEEYFNYIFSDLASKGINNLLIESGAKLNTILLSLNLIDELLIFRSGNIIGNDGIPFIDELGL